MTKDNNKPNTMPLLVSRLSTSSDLPTVPLLAGQSRFYNAIDFWRPYF